MCAIVRRRLVSVSFVVFANALLAGCAPGGGDDADSSLAASRNSAGDSGDLIADARCYRSAASVLLGPSRGGTSEGTPPGWIRLERLGADTGSARLTDSGGAGLLATWSRTPGDSVHVAGFDDFLRVEMRLFVSESQLRGTAVASSDAAAEQDTAGRLQDLRRDWNVTADRASCDSMPASAPGGPR